MNIRIEGGHPAVRREFVAAIESSDGAEANLVQAGGDVHALVDLGLPPDEWAAAADPVAAEASRAEELVARYAGVGRTVRVSSLGAAAESPSRFKRAAAAAEAVYGDRAVILRVGLLLGEFGLCEAIRRKVEKWPVFPVPSLALARLEPLDSRDLAAYCLAAATTDAGLEARYDLGCGEMLTGELVVRHMADNLGVNRLLLPVPPFLRGAVAAWLQTEDAPAVWIQDCLVAMQGWLPRSMKAYEHFSVQPFDLREGFARASGMHIPLRDRDEGNERFQWKSPKRRGVLWRKG